jgi:hypothetical protein
MCCDTDNINLSSNSNQLDTGSALIISRYGSSVVAAVMDVYNSHPWEEWRFHRTPEGFWKSSTNRKRYVLWLYNHLKFSSMEDWYKCSPMTFKENYGSDAFHFHLARIWNVATLYAHCTLFLCQVHP